MGDMGEDFAVMRQASQEKRAKNRANSIEILKTEGLDFRIHNHGAHLVVADYAGSPIDFWPGTGKWIVRADGKSGRGIFNLIKLLRANRTLERA